MLFVRGGGRGRSATSFQGAGVAASNDPKVVAALETIRAKHGLPALGAPWSPATA
jgi:hypothetical protein